MVSDWLSTGSFPHSVQRPSSTQTGIWREVKQPQVVEDGGQELWLRAILQPWTGLKLRLNVGVYAATDVTKIQDLTHPRFPFINLFNINVPLMPEPQEEMSLCLPFSPTS